MTKRIEILLVEDTPSDVRLTQEALKDSGLVYNLNVVTDGVQAVEYLRATYGGDKPVPDLILLDLNMPKKNGHEVLQDMQDMENLSGVPVILLTVSQEDKDIMRAMSLKMNYYVNKPVTCDKLSHVLKAIKDLCGDNGGDGGASDSQDVHVRYVMAGNPHSSPDMLTKLAKETNHRIRCKVAENPHTPESVLTSLAADPDPEVRLSVAENPSAPHQVLEQLVKDENDDVRLGMAANHRLPPDILKMLAQDDNLYVVDLAKKALSTT